MSNKTRDLVVAGVCVLLLAIGGLSQVDWENVLQPEPSSPVYLNGKIAPGPDVPDTKLVTIPDEVYESMAYDKKMARYLSGNQKYVLVVTFGNQPNPTIFKRQLDYLFQEKGYQKYYRKHLINLGNRWYVSCRRHQTCSELWIDQNCAKKVCIIQPQKRQAIIDSSANENQLEKLLSKYKEW